MKIYFNQDGSIRKIAERDLLVATSSGVNVIYAFAPFPSYSTATASFKRADGFTISELKMTKSLDDENCWFIPLEEDTGILNIAGELEITVRFYYDQKVAVMGIVTAHVYRAVGFFDADDDDYYRNYVSKELIQQSLRIEKLEKEPPIAGGKPIHIGDEPPEDTSKIWLDTDLEGEDPIATDSIKTQRSVQPVYTLNFNNHTEDFKLPSLGEVVYELPALESKPNAITNFNTIYSLPQQTEVDYNLPKQSEVDYNLPDLKVKSESRLPPISKVYYNLPK